MWHTIRKNLPHKRYLLQTYSRYPSLYTCIKLKNRKKVLQTTPANIYVSPFRLKLSEFLNKITMNNQEKAGYTLNKVLNIINQNKPENLQETELDLMTKFGVNPLQSLKKSAKKMGLNNQILGIIGSPKIVQLNSLWTCNLPILGPYNKSFLGAALTKKESKYQAQLAAASWLDSQITNNNINIENSVNKAQLFSSINTIQTRNLTTHRESKRKRKPAASSEIEKEGSEAATEAETVSEELKSVKKLFPNPTNALHCFADILSKDFNDKSMVITPQYKSITKSKSNNIWMCTYSLKWPEEMKFSAKASKKKDASHKAAWEALLWLRKNEKIADDGSPIVINSQAARKIRRDSIATLELDQETSASLKNITEIYENELLQHLTSNVDDDNSDIESFGKIKEPEDVVFNKISQAYGDPQRYVAKEKTRLPISQYKEKFMDLLSKHQVLVVKGEPGCGKSTRIPQYVLESWSREAALDHNLPCRIAVTQPRRIAAISLAERVAHERNENVGFTVGYQVRFRSNFRPNTGRILFCTTGILLRYLQSDPKLRNFTHILLDEAHERDVNSDLLMNLLRSSLTENPNLKVIVMSATINTELFSEYFNKAPIMEIPGFTYPVEMHFLDDFKSIRTEKTKKMSESSHPQVVAEDVASVVKYIHKNKPEGAILVFLPGWEDIKQVNKLLTPTRGDMAVYCLHSRLHDDEQWKIFSKPPPGVRKVILATNIAETSVTIDDVVYVIDSGIQKSQYFDIERGINCIDNEWISQASAIQRKGRAGRCQSGESYHLYSKNKFESFNAYSIPEILRTSLTKILLDSKVFSQNQNALEFMSQLPCPPDRNATLRAIRELRELDLLDDNEHLTPLGRTLAEFQLEPSLAKAMVNSVVYKCVTPIVDIVTLYSADSELFSSGLRDKEGVKMIKQKFSNSSDHLAMMRLFESWLQYSDDNDWEGMKMFCENTNMQQSKLMLLQKLRNLHFDYLYNGLCNVLPISNDLSDNDELVKAVLYSGVDSILIHRNWDIVKNRYKTGVNVILTRNNHRAAITTDSVNFKRKKYPSDFLIYINETRSNIRRTTVIRESSLISPLAVLLFSNKPLVIQNINIETFSDKLKSEDQVKLAVLDTNINFICDRNCATEILKCKESMRNVYEYFIYQLTKGNEQNEDLNDSWDNMLKILNRILLRHSIK